MRFIGAVLAFAAALFGQSNQLELCDQQVSSHCISIRAPGLIPSSFTLPLPGTQWIDAKGFTAWGTTAGINDSTASGYVVSNIWEPFVNQDNETRGVSVVVHAVRTTIDEQTYGWDQFGVAGVVKLGAMNMPADPLYVDPTSGLHVPYIRGQQKALPSELYYLTPVTPYTANLGQNYTASLVRVASGVTLNTWGGLIVAQPGYETCDDEAPYTCGGGRVVNGYGIWVQNLDDGAHLLDPANAAAIKIDGFNNYGRITWPGSSLSAPSSGILQLAGQFNVSGSLVANTTPTDAAGFYIHMPAVNSGGHTLDTGVIQYSCPSGTCTTAVINIGNVYNIMAEGDIVTAYARHVGAGALFLEEDPANGTDYVALRAPASVVKPVTFTVPGADGTTGQVWCTNGAGVLGWCANAAAGMSNPMTLAGDIIYASAAGSPATAARLGIGSTGQVLTVSSGGVPVWATGSGPSASGSDQQIQINTSGTFGASPSLLYDYTNLTLSSLGSAVGTKISLALRNSNGGTGSTNEVRIGNDAAADALTLWSNSSNYSGAADYAYVINRRNAPLVFGTNGTEGARLTGGTFSTTNVLLSGTGYNALSVANGGIVASTLQINASGYNAISATGGFYGATAQATDSGNHALYAPNGGVTAGTGANGGIWIGANHVIDGSRNGSFGSISVTSCSGCPGTTYYGGSGISIIGSTISNSGVLSVNASGSGVSVSPTSGAVYVSNTGVTAMYGGTGVGVSSNTGGVTVSIGQAVGTGNSPQFYAVTLTGSGYNTLSLPSGGVYSSTNQVTSAAYNAFSAPYGGVSAVTIQATGSNNKAIATPSGGISAGTGANGGFWIGNTQMIDTNGNAYVYTLHSTSTIISAGYSITGGDSGVTKTCTTLPTVMGGIITNC